ncbi:MAG: hypothetical protein IT200_11965 [Thermoleophilia bacterium]|nr:hypothetical protein [Thermoleophilia bacterium]
MTRIIAVVGACGGAGGTLVATGLALHMQAHGVPAVLLDLDPERGDLAGGLGSTGPRTIVDLLAVAEELTGEHLRSASVVHPGGLTLVPGPDGADTAGVCTVLDAILAMDDRPPLVVDAGSGATPVARRLAGIVPTLLVAPADVAGCRVARRTLRLLGGAPGALLVVNRGSRPDELPPRTVARALGLPLACVVPRAPGEATDLAAGLPRAGRRARLAEAMRELGDALAQEAAS